MVNDNPVTEQLPFRVDEILVIFEIVDGGEIAADDAQTQAQRIFEHFGLALTPSSSFVMRSRGTPSRLVVRARLTDPSLRNTLDAINRLNENVDTQLPFATRLKIRSAGTDLVFGSANWDDGGGPGGRPIKGAEAYFRPDRMGHPPFGDKTFINEELSRILGDSITTEPVGENVNVAILDTWPVTAAAPNDATAAIQAFITANPGASAANPLLNDASQATFTAQFANLNPSSTYAPQQINWSGPDVFETGYDRPSHGLFVAGIIHDIAPRANLLVYRVLTDKGAAFSFEVAAAINNALDRSAEQGRRLVVNLSIGLSVPVRMISILDSNPAMSPADQIAAFKATSNTGSPVNDLTALQGDGEITTTTTGGVVEVDEWTGTGPIGLGVAFLDDIFGEMFDDESFIFVAAAGNDSDSEKKLVFPPRLPAALNGVIGVSSTRDFSWSSSFSNRDDLNSSRNEGVAARGGERIQPTANPYRTSEGPAGLSIDLQLFSPATGGDVPNTDGWAYWAGTSFATPIVTGIIALLLGMDSTLTRTQVAGLLTSPVASGPNNEIVLVQQ